MAQQFTMGSQLTTIFRINYCGYHISAMLKPRFVTNFRHHAVIVLVGVRMSDAASFWGFKYRIFLSSREMTTRFFVMS